MDVFDYDPVTDEEGDLLQTNVVASIGFTNFLMSFGKEYEGFINADDYEQFISDLKMCIEKPNFYDLTLSPGVQVLSYPGKYKAEKSDRAFYDYEKNSLEDYTDEPGIIIVLYMCDMEGFTPSSLHIALDTEETRKFIEYLEDSREIVETGKVIA